LISDDRTTCFYHDDDEDDDIDQLNHHRDLDLAQVEAEDETDLDDNQCSLVTILASDGYTCITSPVISNRSIPIHDQDNNKNGSEGGRQTHIIRCVDSGLSSEEGSSDARHLSSSSSSSNDEIKTHQDSSSSDKSSYSEKQEKESAKETESDRLQGGEHTYLENKSEIRHQLHPN
jgi:hypothetical protein